MSRYGPTSAGLLVTFHTMIIAKITKAATIGKKHKITSSSVPLITVVERNLTVANSSRALYNSSLISSSSSAIPPRYNSVS